MSDDNVSAQVSEDSTSADRLLALGSETRKRRGRPPGSKNRPKDGAEDVSVSPTNQRKIFAGAIVALFSLLAVIMAWFGYEYHKKISSEEAEEGGTYLLPISQKIGWIASSAFYLAFPAWLIGEINDRFRKKPESQVEAPPTRVAGVSSPDSGNSGANGSHPNGATPSANPGGFSPIDLSVLDNPPN